MSEELTPEEVVAASVACERAALEQPDPGFMVRIATKLRVLADRIARGDRLPPAWSRREG